MISRKLRRLVAGSVVLAVGVGLFLTQTLLVTSAPDERPNTRTLADFEQDGWPMFGGQPGRNMVNRSARHIPTTWEVAWKGAGKDAVFDPTRSKNVKWVARLGSRSSAGPVVSGGQVYVGTNNGVPRDPTIRDDRGILMCFRAADGTFLWQAVHDKRDAMFDAPGQGVGSTPTVAGRRLWYVSNRSELVCASTSARADTRQADVLWKLDLKDALGVHPHGLAHCMPPLACSPLVVDDLVFAVTGNGVDEGRTKVPAPAAPSFVAVNQRTGKVVWQDASPGANILHGQWASPSYAAVSGQEMVIFPGGDGWLRAFEPATGKLLWKFDGNPRAAKFKLGGKGDRSEFLAAPVVHEGKLYIGMGQDPLHYTGVGHLWCIDLARALAKGRNNAGHDVSPVNDNFDPAVEVNKNSALAWHHGGRCPQPADTEYHFGRTLSTVAVHDSLVYAAELEGYLHCLDAHTGRLYWKHDLQGTIWGSSLWVDGKVYVGTEDGDVCVFAHGKEKKQLARIEMDQLIHTTPVAADGVLYLVTDTHLFAIVAP